MADTNRTRNIDRASEESYWRENFRTRPYADETRGFDFYRPVYQYGYESAERIGRRPWEEAEPDLRRDWDRYEGRGESTWEEIKDSVKDAWHRITGEEGRPRR